MESDLGSNSTAYCDDRRVSGTLVVGVYAVSMQRCSEVLVQSDVQLSFRSVLFGRRRRVRGRGCGETGSIRFT